MRQLFLPRSVQQKWTITNQSSLSEKLFSAIVMETLLKDGLLNPLFGKLSQLNLDQCNEQHYLFGNTSNNKNTAITPSDAPYSINVMSTRHRKILKKLDLYNADYTLYSWKHTGVVAAYKAGIDIKSIQLQCRHHSLEITDTYLKSLGLNRDNEIYNKMPEL